MNEIEELGKRLYTLEHRVDKNELRITPAEGDIKQIWMFIKNYLADREIKKIGNVQFTKKQLTGFFFPFTLWVTSIVLRFFDVI